MSDYHKAAMLPVQVGALGFMLLSAGFASAQRRADEVATARALAAWDAYYERRARRQAAEALREATAKAMVARAQYEALAARRRYLASVAKDS